MANEQERLTASDLNQCLVSDVYYDENNDRLYYPQPIFTDFSPILGDSDLLIAKNKQALDEAKSKHDLAIQCQEILSSYEEETDYTPAQIVSIDQKIAATEGSMKELYQKLKQQDRENIDDLDLEVLNADLKSDFLGFERFAPFSDSKEPVVKSSYRLSENRLIIVHAAIDTTLDQTPENSAGLILEELRRQGIAVDGSVEITHIIPEIGEGRMDGLFGINHIRLRVAHGNPIDMANSQLIDPRDIWQSTFDTVNCGRYVATMIGQAVGLHNAGLEINAAALKASPIVENAAKFTTGEALQAATKFASEHPIDANAQQDEVTRILERLKQLNHTYGQRAALGLDYNHFWGSFFGGFSADQKLEFSQKILENYATNGSVKIDESDKKIAEQGELGKLVEQLKEATRTDDNVHNESKIASL